MKDKKERGVQRCIYLPVDLDLKLKDYCHKTELPRSYVFKMALKEFFAIRLSSDYTR